MDNIDYEFQSILSGKGTFQWCQLCKMVPELSVHELRIHLDVTS